MEYATPWGGFDSQSRFGVDLAEHRLSRTLAIPDHTTLSGEAFIMDVLIW
jgi:hypothetical protein